jgi:hypothetical protein
MGMTLGNQMGNVAAQNMNTHIAPPPIPQMSSYYLVINGHQQGPFDVASLSAYVQNGQINANTLGWKQGMSNWAALGTLPELSGLFGACPPPIPTNV